MAHDRDSLIALQGLLEQADLILETAPPLPENRTTAARENLKTALAIVGDLASQSKAKAPAVALGRKGGTATAKRHGPEHYRKMAAARKTHAGGRPKKQTSSLRVCATPPPIRTSKSLPTASRPT